MRFTKLVASSVMALAMAACGTGKKDKGDDSAQPAPSTDEEKKAQLEQDYAEIPNAAIVRIPVDKDGNATGEPQMMTYKGTEDMQSAESAQRAFDAGSAPAKMVKSADELDGDTSTQSWTQWDNYGSGGGYGNGGYGNNGYGNNGYGNGGYGNGGYGNNGYGNGGSWNNNYGGWNYNYWQTSYKPVLYYRGYGWNYGYNQPSSYNYGGYSYHCYTPYKYW